MSALFGIETSSTSADNRIGLSDQAQLMQGASNIFTGGGGKAAAQSNTWNIAIVAGLAIILVWLVIFRK